MKANGPYVKPRSVMTVAMQSARVVQNSSIKRAVQKSRKSFESEIQSQMGHL